MTCCARDCSYKHINKTSGRTVHRFPFSRPEILEQWIQNVGRRDWSPRKTSVICSDHFEKHCFITKFDRMKLKKDAVPTVFSGQIIKMRRILKRTEIQEDVKEPDPVTEEICMLRRKLERANNVNLKHRRELKSKQQRIRRLQKRLKTMSRMLDRLKDQTIGNGRTDLISLKGTEIFTLFVT